MFRGIVLAAAAVAAMAAPALAQEKFAITGTQLGSNKDDYTGTVIVNKTGSTWKVEWNIPGESPIKGTGVILNGCCAAVTGMHDGKPFVFLMKADGVKYTGVWTVDGETQVGRETWIPQ